MKKLLSLFALLASSCFAQQTNTVYLQLASNLTAMPSPAYYAVTNNVGQTFHTFAITLGGSGTCGEYPLYANFTADVEASYDGSHYTFVPQVRVSWQNDYTDTFNNVAAKFYKSTGAYPYVRIHITHFPDSLPTACSIGIGYTGSLNGTTLSDGSNNLQTVIYSNVSATCQQITFQSSGVDSDSPIGFNIVGMNITNWGTTPETDLYFNFACTGTPDYKVVGPVSVSLPVTENRDPLFILAPNTNAIKMWAESPTGNSTIILRGTYGN